MTWYEWKEGDYPLCPLCMRSTPYFIPYKKGVERIQNFKTPKGKVMALGKCLLGCEFKAIVPITWENSKLSDPNGILKEWKDSNKVNKRRTG